MEAPSPSMFPVSPREEDETWIWCEPVALV
jgi:hypothetical protein